MKLKDNVSIVDKDQFSKLIEENNRYLIYKLIQAQTIIAIIVRII